jgi:putative nucleotidyltransferase with HDIG domain
MKEELLRLMPEFQMVGDSSLRDKTIKVWVEAMKKKDWDSRDLLEMPFTLLIEQTPINIITHTRAVTLCAAQIADVLLEEYGDNITLNRDHLISGALLHDVGKLFEYKREGDGFSKSEEGKMMRHPLSGADFATKFGLPQDVIHIIAAHSKEGDGARRTVEAVIVHHADFVNFDALKL